MKKIMFNDRYGLTEAVLTGRKTMTRRKVNTSPDMTYDFWNPVMGIDDKGKVYFTVDYCDGRRRDIYPQYQIGEVLAIAQSYKSVCKEIRNLKERIEYKFRISCLHHTNYLCSLAGWNNKMFVKPELMPHRIRITNIRLERLQDISDKDCLREGVYKDEENGRIIGYPIGVPFFYTFTGAVSKKTGKQLYWTTPKEAFSELIDLINGSGTWQRNPWVFVYEFELVSQDLRL